VEESSQGLKIFGYSFISLEVPKKDGAVLYVLGGLGVANRFNTTAIAAVIYEWGEINIFWGGKKG